ncbi:MAG TPA: TraR/DksA C4-type zinc finger protein [Dermatophilaceae bacterium]|jgi:RNA polymerase-binding transcription factor DksA
MAVKKATSATKRGAQAKKAAPAKSVVTKNTTKAGATKVAATKSAVTKTATRAGATKSVVTKSVVTKAGATKVGATKSVVTKTATRTPPGVAAPKAGATKAGARPQRLQVRENEKPWTAKELGEVRAELEADVVRLQKEISAAEYDLAGLMRDVGDGAGDDPADAGTATFEREQEISLANNAREVFEQSARALARLVAGTYGICESCGSPIGKNRLLAFPRATLCLTCKSKQERR